MPDSSNPNVSIPLTLLVGLVAGFQHALDDKTTAQTALTQDAADKASLQSKLDAQQTDLDTVKSQLSDLKASQDAPLPDDLHAQIDTLLATPAPVVLPPALADPALATAPVAAPTVDSSGNPAVTVPAIGPVDPPSPLVPVVSADVQAGPPQTHAQFLG